MRNIFCLLALCCLIGCASTADINRNYDRLAHFEKGVNPELAKVIAQRMLLKTAESDRYRITYPDIKVGKLVDKYPGYWFVVFGHNWFEPMSQSPYAGTYRELIAAEFLVVIDKNTGKVPFFGEWYPKRENDFDWVFDQHAYNRKDSLSLPPGRQSKDLF